MNQNLKKWKQNNGLADAGFVGLFSILDRYLHALIEKGGIFTLLLLPLFEFIRAGLYWRRSAEPDLNDDMGKIGLNRVYYLLKAVGASIGVGLVLSGMMLQGFAVIIAGGYAGTLRYLVKTIQYAFEGNVSKTERNLQKMISGGMVVGGFTLLAFYPSLAFVGWSMVLAATSTAVLSGSPKIVAELVKKPETAQNALHYQAVGDNQSEQRNDSLVRFFPGTQQQTKSAMVKLKME